MREIRGISMGIILASAVVLASLPVRAADEVLSGNIREADNKTGQNTNAGSGIKTNHIQNDAVTSKKIKDGNVATADLANNAVTSAKIKDGNVFTADLADGSVTASKVGFYSQVIIVDANGGGDFASPVDAMNAITDASETRPYLVKIMPGVYDVGGSTVTMKDHVDIEGSGEGVTTIKGSVPSVGGVVVGLVSGANAEIRFLSIENKTFTGGAIGFISGAGGVSPRSPSLLHVRVRAQGWQTGDISAGVYIDGSPDPANPTRLSHVRAEGIDSAVACGISMANVSSVLSDVEAVAWGGRQNSFAIWNNGGNPVLRRVTATANYPATGAAGLGNVGVYNQNTFADLQDVTAFAAQNAMTNDGVRNESATARLVGVTAEGQGSSSYGLKNVAAAGSYGVTVDRCDLKGGFGSIHNNPEFTTKIGGSKLGGIINGMPANVTCTASYTASYTALETDCVPVGCVRPTLTFDLGGAALIDAGTCAVMLDAEAATACCSGSLASPFYQADPPICRGTCN